MGKLGLQVYTVREEAAKDFPGTLHRVAEMGYPGVELSGYYGLRATAMRKVLADCGLDVAGTVVPWEVLERGLEGAIEYSALITCPAIVCPILPEAQRTLAGFHGAAEHFNGFAKKCMQAGIQFLYHIHGVEFGDLGGCRGIDILFAETDPGLVSFEADVYWIEKAGVSSVEFLDEHGGRCPYIHFKDKTGTRDVEVGAGDIDMRGVICQAKRHSASWFIVEQEAFDMPPMESAAISLRNLRRLTAEC